MKLLLCLITCTTFSFALGYKDEAKVIKHPINCSRSKHLNVTLQRQVLKSGFHRELSIRVTIMNVAANVLNDCHLLIKEELPRDVFVDPYQVGHLNEQNTVYQIYLPFHVDLEAAAHDSDPQTVYIFINTSAVLAHANMSIIIPFHLRYQRAAFADQSGEYAEVYWISPSVLSRCEGHNHLNNCSHDYATEFCGPDDHRDCLWIKYHEIEPSTLLDFHVPRGDLSDLPLVASITSIVVLAGCTYLIKSLLRPTKQKLKSA